MDAMKRRTHIEQKGEYFEIQKIHTLEPRKSAAPENQNL
jgi:hypothetical protein